MPKIAKPKKKCHCANQKVCPHPLYIRTVINGRRRWVNLETNSKTVANRIVDKRRGDRAQRRQGLPVEPDTVTHLSTAITDYLIEARLDHPATADSKDAP